MKGRGKGNGSLLRFLPHLPPLSLQPAHTLLPPLHGPGIDDIYNRGRGRSECQVRLRRIEKLMIYIVFRADVKAAISINSDSLKLTFALILIE